MTRKPILIKYRMIALLCCAMVAVILFFLVSKIHEMKHQVKTQITATQVRVTTATGHVLITHLSAKVSGRLIVAELPRHHLIVDSAPHEIMFEEVYQLDWRTEAGEKSKPPSDEQDIKTITALYIRLSSSE